MHAALQNHDQQWHGVVLEPLRHARRAHEERMPAGICPVGC